MRKLTTKERGLYKIKINNAFLKSDNIMELILGDIDNLRPQEKIAKFKERINSHLFIDDSIKETGSYIFYDIYIPALRPQIKDIKIIIYAICHRDILEDYAKEGYYGNRSDILSQMIEETLLDPSIVKQYGIGDLSLDNVDIYNSNSYYGTILTFNVPNFR